MFGYWFTRWVVIIFVCINNVRCIQELYAWLHDTKSNYYNWLEKWFESKGLEFEYVMIWSISIPPLGYLAVTIWPLTLFVLTCIGLAHLTRFAIRVNTKLRRHIKERY